MNKDALILRVAYFQAENTKFSEPSYSVFIPYL